MYTLKRIIAYSIDHALMLVVSGALYTYLSKMLIPMLSNIQFLDSSVHTVIASAIFMGFPIVIIGTMSGAFGWTPGKLLCFLRVHNNSGNPPGITQGILREVVKVVGLSFMFFGVIWALYGIITSDQAFYDDWIGTNVDDLKPVGLTETQKKFREFQKEEKKRKK